MVEIVIDFEYLRGDHDNIIVKELAIAGMDELIQVPFMNTYHFSPPYEKSQLSPRIRISNDWLTNYVHKLDWNDGDIWYFELRSILYKETSGFEYLRDIHVKGSEKAKFLREKMPHIDPSRIIDLNERGCPNICDFKPLDKECCKYHNQDTKLHCASYKAMAYLRWVMHGHFQY